MEQLSGKSAVVTGAAGGMGRSIALALAASGVNVAVSDIDEAGAHAVAGEVEALGAKAIAVAVDISRLEEVEHLATLARDAFGTIEILINNAGVTLRPYRASWDTSLADLQWIMDVNFWGVVHGHMAFVKHMLESPGEKHIVNTSSIGSLMSVAGHSAYCASKAAIDGYSYCVREELARFGIGVSLLHPGPVRTRIATSERLRDESDRSENRAVVPWASYVTDIANPIVDRANSEPEVDPVLFAEDPWQWIWPDDVGRLVVEGIRANKPNILTHPPLTDKIMDRAQAVIAGAPQPQKP